MLNTCTNLTLFKVVTYCNIAFNLDIDFLPVSFSDDAAEEELELSMTVGMHMEKRVLSK